MNLSRKSVMNTASILIAVTLIAGIGFFTIDQKADGKTIASNGIYGYLNKPSSIEFDSLGNMYIVNDLNTSITKVEPDGSITVVNSGGAYGTFNNISDIEFDAQGNMYISNLGSNTINKITPGGVLSVIANNGIYGALASPSNLEFDANGNLFIANNTQINKITPQGVITVVQSGGIYGDFVKIEDISFDNEGTMCITDSDSMSVTVIPPVDEDILVLEFDAPVYDTAFDSNGNVYIAESNRIHKITESEVITISDGEAYGELKSIRDIEFDSQGNLYIANSGNNSINKIVNYSGVYAIRSKNSNLLMDVYNSGKDKGTNIIQWPATGGANQKWTFELLDNGYYKITSVLNPTYSLDVYNAGAELGNRVIQWTYHGGTNQQWKLIENTDGTISFMSRLAVEGNDSIGPTNYLLDVYGGGKDQGVNVIQWTGHYGDNQKWYLDSFVNHNVTYDSNGGSAVAAGQVEAYSLLTQPTAPTKANSLFDGWFKDEALTQKWDFSKDRMPANDITLYAKWIKSFNGTYVIRSKNSNLVMDVFNQGQLEGVNIIQWPENGQTNQQWKFESLGNGYYKITSVLNPTFSLDVFNRGLTLGNRVIQWTYHAGTNQQWKIIDNTDGSVSFMSRLAEENGTGYLLDVYNGGTDQGVNVIQWTAHYRDNQKWLLEDVVR